MANTTIIEFLKKHTAYFTLSDIEKTMDIPQSTLYKAISGRRNLTEDQEQKVVQYVSTMRKELDKMLQKLD